MGVAQGACDGCPFEGVYHGGDGGWLSELLGARLLVADEHLPWPDALARPLAAVDVEALRVWKGATARINAKLNDARTRDA